MIELEKCEPIEPEIPEELVVKDEDSLVLYDVRTGEAVGYSELPPEDAEPFKIGEWISERRAYHIGRLAGLEAEMDAHLERIHKIYDPQIKRHRGAMAWFDTMYHSMLLELAKRLIGDGKKRHAVVGLMTLSLIKTRAHVDINDKDKALNWLELAAENQEDPEIKAKLLAAIKVEKSVLKSNLPDDLKAKLVNPVNQERTGMAYYPGGEDELTIK
jgi:hypothetical protein